MQFIPPPPQKKKKKSYRYQRYIKQSLTPSQVLIKYQTVTH
jgi:hypothetical protein